MISITEYLNNILDDFKEYLSKNQELCKLKDLNFSNENIPDYNDVNLQQLYILRYGLSYAFDYYKIAYNILKECNDYDKIRVLSVGCGTGIDYWGFVNAIEKYKSKISIDYVGIDLVDWSYKFEFRDIDNGEYIISDISKYLDSIDEIDFDVIMFPKSISEFSEYKQIVEKIKSKITSKTLFVGANIRKKESEKKNELSRLFLLEYELLEGKYNEVKSVFKEYKEDEAFITIDPFFKHADGVIDLLDSLNKCCYKDNNRYCELCSSLNRKPILKTNNTIHKIYEFTRSD